VVNPRAGVDTVTLLTECLQHVYDVREDDLLLRETLKSADSRGEAFDQLRKGYAARRECTAYRVDGGSMSDEKLKALTAFGFSIVGI